MKISSRTKILSTIVVILVVSISLATLFFQNPGIARSVNLKRVACVGDSITEITRYPNDLQSLIDGNSVVGNFGSAGSTVVFNSGKPYVNESAFENAKEFLPTTVVIMLGTNDARTDNFKHIDNFTADYTRIVKDFQELESKPQVFLVKPPPIFNNVFDLNNTNLLNGVIPRIENVADTLGLHVIDVYSALINHPEYFPDGVHPSDKGAEAIASEIFKGITEK